MPTTTTWRRITVWLHVLTSVGWAALAASLAVLQVSGADPADRGAALSGAHHLDSVLLAPLAAGSALTGMVLAAATPYGFLHHRWVATKLAITLVQLYLGIGVISVRLDAAHADPAGPLPPELLPLTLLMVAAIAFQAWLSVDKPWGRTRWSAGRPRPVTGPRWMFAAASAAVVADLVAGFALGHPAPVASVVVLVAVLVGRTRATLSRGRRAGSTSPAT
ncbi:hypothetical protein [Pseudonocardia spirodelae]|uniref:DUF2269 domain-containing protein n=1 Tax=Pseudonocardia spirodelae TaxID=3133431 RepID=A0ABU8T476_9PSEU